MDWAQTFGRAAPLTVEVGFGNGEFLAAACREQPDWNWVGLETSLTCVTKAARKLAAVRASHVRLALVDGKFALRELFPDESVHRVYVHFPCPWPKARHARRRLVDPEFVQTLSAVLAPWGEFVLVTDVRSYAEESARYLQERGFSLQGPELVPERGPGTRYEMRWRKFGRSIWRLVAQRGPKGEIERMAEGAVPHVKLAVPFEPQRVLARLAGLREAWDRGAFVVKEGFVGQDGKSVLWRTFATDAGFQQQFFLAVVEEKGGTMVKLDEATLPFRTPAVKRAVARAAQKLEEP